MNRTPILARLLCVAVSAYLCTPSYLPAQGKRGETKYFEDRVRPLLVKHCYGCHGEDLSEGKLRLDTKNGWERAGDRGGTFAVSSVT